MMAAWQLCVLFVISAVVGYFLISQVPSLLHTPLMSGMNALSGITVLGALAAAAHGHQGLAFAAIILAMVNVVGGFWVTDLMLKMFKKEKGAAHDE